MNGFWSFAALIGLCGGLIAQADEPIKPAKEKKATFSITGLHCPPCTRTVESSLKKVPGVKSAKVDWATKSAKLAFDESKVTVHGITSAIASTPHMMGPNMSYSALLALSVPDLKDETSAQQAKDALTNVAGVAKVNTYPQQHTVSIRFAPGNDITSDALIEALDKVGMAATTY